LEETQNIEPKAPLEERSSFLQLMILVSIILLTSGVFYKLAFLSSNKIFGINNSLEILSNEDLWLSNRNVLIFIQMFISIGTFILPGILFMYLVSYKPFQYIKITKAPPLQLAALTIAVMFVGSFAVDLSVRLIELIPFESSNNVWIKLLLQAEEQALKGYEAFLAFEGLGGFLIVFVLMAVLPAIGEELIFRGLIQNIFLKTYQNPHIAVGFSAFWFALVHAQLTNFLALALMGVVLGYLYYWTKNLWIPILAHLFNNGLIVVATAANKQGWINFDIQSTDALPWYVSLIGTFAFILLFLWYKKFANQPKNQSI
jgi:membrane protease YdiL (CAAX protease family)